MITNVSLITVFVTDQDEAKTFYIDVLGFEESTDVTLGDGYRWCTVRHPKHPELELTLMRPGPPLDDETAEAFRRLQAKGGLPGVGLTTDDCHGEFATLSAKGVTFLQEPSDRPYGIEAVLRDNSGNWLELVEPREYTGEDFIAHPA